MSDPSGCGTQRSGFELDRQEAEESSYGGSYESRTQSASRSAGQPRPGPWRPEHGRDPRAMQLYLTWSCTKAEASNVGSERTTAAEVRAAAMAV